MDKKFYMQMLSAATSIGLPVIGRHTAAKILFLMYRYGGDQERLVYSPKFVAEIDYIKKIYNIDGGEIPDSELAEYLRKLDSENTDEIPQWANDLCKERYGFKLTNNLQ